ncbi:MAG: heme-binding domain-containing protein [Sphingobacteriaceae bacterium]
MNIGVLLKTTCYDCHSNNTIYPWYSRFQSVGWWLQSHIKDGKAHLNFDEFSNYQTDKKKKKLSAIVEEVEKGEMPLSTYTLIHFNANLSKAQRKEIADWATTLKENLKN